MHLQGPNADETSVGDAKLGVDGDEVSKGGKELVGEAEEAEADLLEGPAEQAGEELRQGDDLLAERTDARSETLRHARGQQDK